MGGPQQLPKTGPMARFDPKLFTATIQAHGFWFRWSRALTCPCRLNAVTDQWDPTCARCGGDGWLYVNPCAATERHLNRDYSRVQAIFSSVDNKPSISEEFGGMHFGEAQLTVHNTMRVTNRDRFVSEEQLIGYSELLVRGAADDVPVGKSRFSRDVQRTAMRYEPVEINYVADDDGAGNETVYYAGEDFVLKPITGENPAQLSWLPGEGPPVGRLYTLHYVMHPVWIVDDAVYLVQHGRGPLSGLKGKIERQLLPTTFKMKLDYLTEKRSP
jgi:hypothetical protein